MARAALRLSVYFGERDRVGARLLADVLLDLFERERVRTSLLLRGIEGFGIKHRLHSERLLTLSEDLPLLALAVDTPERIEALARRAHELSPHGAIAVERARSVDGDEPRVADLGRGAEEVKLTLYLARQQRTGGRAAHEVAVDCLHRNGVAGASALLGLDGTVRGVRHRARFFASNAQVPLMVQSVGAARAIAPALGELAAMLPQATMTLERVRVCKRDGALLAQPHECPSADGSGLNYWQKLVVYSSERARYGHQPLHSALVARLRMEGAPGATALRGQWGYHGEHRPHGETFWSLRRHVPVLTLVLDTPEKARRWFAIVDQMTRETGLVTSELLPALRVAGPSIEHGGLALAARPSL